MKSNVCGLLFEGIVLAAVVLAPFMIVLMILTDITATARSAVLSVEGLCCNHSASVAEQRLQRIDGVKTCVADRDSQTLRLVLRDSSLSTFQAVWDAAEENSLRPVELNFRGISVLGSRQH
jgi:copper chaperone CopZ